MHMQENYGCHFYARSVNAVRAMKESFDELFKRFDIITMPTIKYKPPVLPEVGLSITGKIIKIILCHHYVQLCAMYVWFYQLSY